jgi:putative solute:sodium symporter small subunit
MPEISLDAKRRHWARTRSLTVWMLVIWFIFSFVIPWFAGPLNDISFLGFPLGYYMIVQGSLIVFVVQIFFQNWMQDKIDDEAGVGEK